MCGIGDKPLGAAWHLHVAEAQIHYLVVLHMLQCLGALL